MNGALTHILRADGTLRGSRQVTGTADDNTGVISRTYTGTVHFD
jgi:hypothetical protein